MFFWQNSNFLSNPVKLYICCIKSIFKHFLFFDTYSIYRLWEVMGARRAPEGDIGAEIKKFSKVYEPNIFWKHLASRLQNWNNFENRLRNNRDMAPWLQGEDSEIGLSGSLCSNLILGAVSGFGPPCLVPLDRGSKVLQHYVDPSLLPALTDRQCSKIARSGVTYVFGHPSAFNAP